MSTMLTCGTPWQHRNSAPDGDQSIRRAAADARTPGPDRICMRSPHRRNAGTCRGECIEPDGGLVAKVLRDSRMADGGNWPAVSGGTARTGRASNAVAGVRYPAAGASCSLPGQGHPEETDRSRTKARALDGAVLVCGTSLVVNVKTAPHKSSQARSLYRRWLLRAATLMRGGHKASAPQVTLLLSGAGGAASNAAVAT
jgi:hypothetical protein